MLRLATVLAATALLTAAPTFAEQRDREAEPRKLPPCCERVAMQTREHDALRETERKTERTAPKAKEQNTEMTAPRVEEGPFVRNQSWGG